MQHPLAAMLDGAARGRPPPDDGATEVLPAPPGMAGVVVGFVWHLVVASSVDERQVRAELDRFADPAAATDARFLTWLAAALGSRPGSFDLVMAALGTGTGADLVERTDLDDHPRVQRARRYRPETVVLSDANRRGLVVLGRGIVGRWELAFEVDPEHRERGLGRALVAGALGLVPAGEPLYAQVAPANVASVRALLAAGYTPIACEVIFPSPK